MPSRSLPPSARARGVTAVLGPTNTGKTHLAIERLCAHSSGIIGLPLRLLAREVYARVVERVGAEAVALVTGEEKIKPPHARYWVATAEAMPRDLDVAFVAIDEIQLATDLDRGHVFTDRILNRRGREETLLLGSLTMKPLVEALIPGVHVVTRPRLSNLAFAGDRKLSRLPPRSAIVAFSAEEVYAIAELIRRYRGGAAVVLGALSPRTRNAQVALYQAGDVDYLVATDAVGMGLNLDVGHVGFASRQKYDGFQFRDLTPAEMGQIAGRAGRHMRDGTFGSTGRCDPFDPELIDRLENHRFDPAKIVQWRNPDLDTRTLAALQASLAETPREPGLTRALIADDEAALSILARDPEVTRRVGGRAEVERLWEVCALPDYRRISPAGHADMIAGIHGFLRGPAGRIPDDWFARHVAMVDRVDGDIDTLSGRLAHVRTWTFVANRPDWLTDPEHWQGVTRRIEDTLSDALHERLAARFVDRRTSVLMRRLRENVVMEADITAGGDVTVEGQHVGSLLGFHFVPDPLAQGEEARALRAAAAKALAGEIEARADRFAAAPDSALVLSNDGTIRWTGDPVAKLEPGEKTFDPGLRILADEQLTGPARDRVEARLRAWLKAHVTRLLGTVIDLETAADITGLARGIAFQVAESLGILERSRVAQDLKSLDQTGRATLRGKGVRFGAYHVYMPALVKPAPRILSAQLWALKNGGLDQKGIDEIAHLAGSGRTSFTVDPEIAKGLYRAAGFRVCGNRAVRVDILERLADLIRPAIAYRPGTTPGEAPAGAADGEGFVQTPAMTSLVGTAGEDFGSILKSLGYVSDTRAGPAITVPLVPARAVAPTVPAAAAEAAPDETVSAPAGDAEAEGGLAPTPTLPVEPMPDGGVADAPEIDGTVTGAPGEVEDADASDDPDPGVQDDAPDEAAGSDRGGLVDHTLEEAADRFLAEAPAADEGGAEESAVSTSDGADGLSAAEADPLEAADEPDPGIQDAPDDVVPRSAAASDLDALSEPGDEPAAPTELESTPDEAAALSVSDPLGDTATMISAPADADAVQPAEPVTIEVWRLSRHGRENRPQHARGRHGRPEGRGGDRRDGGGRRDGGQPGPERPPGERSGPRPAYAGGRPGGPSERRDGGAPGGDRAARPDGRPPRRDDRPRSDRPQGDRPFGDRPRGGGGDRPGGGERREWRGAERPRDERRPERRERQPDPNSPFAALAGLKAQLESKDRDGR